MAMRWLMLGAAVLGALPAQAQASRLFGKGKPVTFQETQADQQFTRTRLARALSSGNDSPECVQLLGGLFTLLGEAAPRLHSADENFYLEPALIQALQTQLSLPRFAAAGYFRLMVRRVLISGRMPEEWLTVAQAVNPQVQIIDLGKLKLLADGARPIDSLYATLPALVERHKAEVEQANSAASDSAESAFKDGYLDHTVVFGGLILKDVEKDTSSAVHARRAKAEEGPRYVAHLEFHPEVHKDIKDVEIPFFRPKRKDPVYRITARLAQQQYVELKGLARNTRVLVRGRLFDYKGALTQVEIRDALLFEDRDFSKGVVLADPNGVARCGLAVNDLGGLAPNQPGGFRH